MLDTDASPPPIEVFHTITRLVQGGAARVLLDLLADLDRTRFRPVLCAGLETGSEGSLWDEAGDLGIELVRLPSLVREVSPRRDLRALRDLTRLVRDRRPAVVHGHTSKAGFLLGRAAHRAARGAGARPRIVLSPHGHIAGAGAQIPGVPRRGGRRWILSRLARRSARDADVVVCPNEAERRDGIDLGMWEEANSVVVPNGVDVELFVPAERGLARSGRGWSAVALIVGVVARLTREKGVDLALDAIAPLDGVHLVVVGDGPERVALQDHARRLGIDERVEFLGVRRDVATLLPALDVVLVPSRTEAHGMVAPEALSCEIPVVATAVGGLRDIVATEHNGLLVPPGEPAAMTDALGRLLTDAPWRERLGRTGRRDVIDRWSRAAMVRETELLYAELIAEHIA